MDNKQRTTNKEQRIKLHSIHAGHFSCDGGALFGVIPKPLWSMVYPADENNVTKLTLRCLLVETENKKVLIETGVGNHYNKKYTRNNGLEDIGVIEKSLNEKGFSVDEITDVVFTHLHWDHCNGAVKSEGGELKLQFPNATHWCSKMQWEHCRVSNIRERTAFHLSLIDFIAENGNLQLLEKEGKLFPGIEVHFFDGHTPGQMIPFIHTEEKTFVYTSDLIPTAANIPVVWLAAYDLYPVVAMEEKEKFLKEACENNYVLFFEHDFYTQCATVEMTEKGPKLKSTLIL